MTPLRTCIACRKKGEKENFIKIVKNKNGSIAIESDKKRVSLSMRALLPVAEEAAEEAVEAPVEE